MNEASAAMEQGLRCREKGQGHPDITAEPGSNFNTMPQYQTRLTQTGPCCVVQKTTSHERTVSVMLILIWHIYSHKVEYSPEWL